MAVGLFEAYGQQSAARANPATADFRQFLTEHRADLGAADAALTTITVDYPREGSVFPLDFAAPLFQWRDASSEATVWRVEVSEPGRKPRMKVWSAGEKMQIGPVDASLVGFVQPTLTAEQAASHTWRPDAKTWEEMKKHSQRAPVTVRLTGYRNQSDKQAVSTGVVTVATSPDPVGAPIMYRDVPLIPPPPESEERGVIKPLPDSVLPMIKWQLRYVSDSDSKTVMTGLPTCANCHSLSRDGKTMGIDVDGPQNDKGLYALIPVKPVSTMSNEYVIHWSAFSEERAQKRFGFMSQSVAGWEVRDHRDRCAACAWDARGGSTLQRVLSELRIRPGVLSDARGAGLVQQGERTS